MSSNNSNMTKLWSAISIDVIKQLVQNSKKHCQIEMAMTIPSSLLTKNQILKHHSLIRGVLIQSCSAGAKKFTNYVFCHPQFSGVIQNIENHCAIKAK